MHGKNINVFLMDGTANGRIKCTMANWTGVVYKIPRTELEHCKNRSELKQSGVYFLFGESTDTGKPVTYIGQAGNRKNGEGILNRLFEHKHNADKNYWNEAVVFTTSNNSFGPTEISFLENKFCNLAGAANRYEVKNANDPSPGHITEEKESEMEEFVEYAKIIMGTLGHNVFESVAGVKLESDSQTDTDEPIFYLSRKIQTINFYVDATGKPTSEGFVVFKGSKISPQLKNVVSDSTRNARINSKIDDNNVLLEDVLFATPSGAGEFVIGNTCNGWTNWKTKAGVTLKDFEGGDKI